MMTYDADECSLMALGEGRARCVGCMSSRSRGVTCSTTPDSANVAQCRQVGRGHDGAGGIRARGLAVRRATVKGRSNTADQLRSATQ